MIILRRGKKVARLVPFQRSEGHLPSLREFRSSIRIKGRAVSTTVILGREKERY